MARRKKVVKKVRKVRKSSGPGPIPARIFAQASPRSLGGVSMFESHDPITTSNVGAFYSDAQVVEKAVSRLREAGFEVLQATATTINIAGSQKTFERAFQTRIEAEERAVIKPGDPHATATFLECPDTAMPGLIGTAGTPFADVLEGVALEEPRYFMAASAFAPPKSYWHLRLPGDVSLGCNADRAHRGGITGRGIRVAMVDSGWYRHPYFVGRGYRVAPVVLGPAAANPLQDESGHGTGESANIFAVAPDAELQPVKINFVNSIGAFNAAVALAPHVITCSWGSSKVNAPLSAADQALAAAIAAAVLAGIVVVFSAGNGHWGFPGQHPDVISAGGVFLGPDGSLKASDYASGFLSNVYPGRRVPDLCGLVGLRPRAIYLMLPLEPADAIDVGNSGGTHPNGDETASNDGWAAFSGTSAAAPQLAGAVALLKEACNKLTPPQIREVLVRTARDVTTGTSNPSTGGHPAAPGPDLATGAGLVDAHKAVLLAKVKCLPIGPLPPIQPPIVPAPPAPIVPPKPGPVIPPISPVLPVPPIPPIRPGPINPGPIMPPLEDVASSPTTGGGLSPEDVHALENMITESED